jgi:hypothetical protein
MRNFRKITEGCDIAPVVAELRAHPELWNAYAERTHDPNSPHFGVPDIWVRFRPRRELVDTAAFREPHFAEFYPAWYVLPSLHSIVYDLMAKVRATYLGGILITKIPSGGQVKPHNDRGGWHAETMNMKVYVPLLAPAECVNFCEDESVVMQAGEAWHFDNLKEHSVENRSDSDRITAIICMRCEA